MTRKLMLMIVALVIAAGLVPLAANAESDPCAEIQVIVFGNNGAPVSFNMGALPSLVDAVSGTCPPLETNYLSPGTTSVSVRLFGLDLGRSVPQVTATLNGLSHTDKAVTLKRTEDPTTGGITYDSDDVAVSGTGDITAVVKTAEGDYSGTYRTLV